MKKSFETPASVTLDVKLSGGRVELVTSEQTTTDVEVVPLAQNETSRRAADNCQVEMVKTGRRSHVQISAPRTGLPLLGKEPSLLVTVHSRVGADVEATVASATVNGRGMFGSVHGKTASGDFNFEQVGELDVKSASGEVAVERIAGPCKVDTASGDVRVEESKGPVRIRSASGDVTMDRVEADAKVQTASGDLLLRSVASGRISLQSASGDMKIGVAQGSTLWVDAKSLSGETTSDLDIGEQPPDIEGPHVDLRATSMSGDIHVARADILI